MYQGAFILIMEALYSFLEFFYVNCLYSIRYLICIISCVYVSVNCYDGDDYGGYDGCDDGDSYGHDETYPCPYDGGDDVNEKVTWTWTWTWI